jgi:hypothetical protein
MFGVSRRVLADKVDLGPGRSPTWGECFWWWLVGVVEQRQRGKAERRLLLASSRPAGQKIGDTEGLGFAGFPTVDSHT